jgi:lipopolysaccharide export system protein LptA
MPKSPEVLKRKVLLATVAAGAIAVVPIAVVPQMRSKLVQPAYAQEAAVNQAPVVEMPPPSGEVQAPSASTISAPPRSAVSAIAPDSAPALSPVAPAAASGHAKKASTKDDSKDTASDSSPFGGFDSSSNHGPINIKSDTMSFDYKKNAVLFSGHVHAVQTANELYSNTLHVQMNKDSQIQEMIADGNVRMSQGQRWATGDHAVLDETVHTLVLTGSPVVHDGKDQIAGTKITVFLQTNKSEVTEPKAVIFPHESKKPNNGEAPAAEPTQIGAGD